MHLRKNKELSIQNPFVSLYTLGCQKKVIELIALDAKNVGANRE